MGKLVKGEIKITKVFKTFEKITCELRVVFNLKKMYKIIYV